MAKKRSSGVYDSHGYDPNLVHGNFGPGGFGDQYDNERMRSLDRGDRTGGVSEVPIEDDIDLNDMEFTPSHGARWKDNPAYEPARNADLGLGASGSQWNRDLPDYGGKGPKGWRISDKKLLERVCEVLLHSHDVDPSDIEVFVEEGVVTLVGSIASRGMKSVAEDLVGSIPGVVDVFTRLKTKEQSSVWLSDRALNEARQTDQS